MFRYSEIFVALDFADKYEATSVTIETDDGKLDMSPADAIQAFSDLSVGESFTLLSIQFDN